ncbi:MurR/RpiR family transcriptional regulator [Coprobacillus sp. AF18-15LB]|nr:MurR/RpiR family transcriptional regulator [Coprobacillus sp. AF18-40]RGT85939.1 MurR/RpiR family transcriptional regulator [Coprobacillus sp. AF18-15LB]
MFIIQKIETMHLSSSQSEVARYLLDKKLEIENKTIYELARETYTSPATIVRLAKKLGYEGYEAFKKDFLDEQKYILTHFKNIDPNFPFNKNDSIQTIASKMTILTKESADDTLSLIKHDNLQKAVSLLQKARIIHLSAISYSLLLGQTFQLNMNRLGKLVNICPVEGEELFMNNLIQKEDCLLMISYSGQINQMLQLARLAKGKGVPIIVITSLGDNELKKYGDVVLNISTREKLYSKIGGFVNENSIKLILDILYACYFDKDYEGNLNKRIHISKESETTRFASLDIMKESEP